MPNAPLIATTYNYLLPPGIPVRLTKISTRATHSVTTANGTTMRKHVFAHDNRCWISGGSMFISTNSHVCPKQMGDYVARQVYRDFVKVPARGLSIFSPIFRITLSKNLDAIHLLTLYLQGMYESHYFVDALPRFHWTNRDEFPTVDTPLHGYRTSPPQPNNINNPPAGLFRWPHLQCPLKVCALRLYAVHEHRAVGASGQM
ncbi:hypothetical protein DFH09DRAFT_1139434 [Mycena vulgaris]|nr:hypothetical protein DFH09DRAFT_1139434 [Mycena vulgaris]